MWKRLVPKPYGELRLEYPAPKYQKFENNVPILLNTQILLKLQMLKNLAGII
jgi:hypothetical protein